MITEKETQFLEEVIREHPHAIEKLISSYNRRLPMNAQTLFSLYVKKGKHFADQLDEIDSQEPEVSGFGGKAIKNVMASDVMKSAYGKLSGKAKTVAPVNNVDSGETDTVEEVEEPKKSTYKIFGKEISKYLVWAVSAVAALLLTWGIVALINRGSKGE